MNLTVGPLPPAVYWRRRAIVAGGLLLVILLIVYSCGGPGSPDAKGPQQTAVEESQSSTAGVVLPGLSPSATPSMPSLSPFPSEEPSPSPTATATEAGGGAPSCSDADMKISASIESTSAGTSKLQYGGTFALKLKIQNVSDHACTRDVGSVPERLTISQGKTKIWSSDDCDSDSGAKSHDVRTFQANILIYAQVEWSSYLNTAKSCSKGKTPAARGKYQLTGELGTAKSAVTSFTIS
jgi:hypothetical protein